MYGRLAFTPQLPIAIHQVNYAMGHDLAAKMKAVVPTSHEAEV